MIFKVVIAVVGLVATGALPLKMAPNSSSENPGAEVASSSEEIGTFDKAEVFPPEPKNDDSDSNDDANGAVPVIESNLRSVNWNLLTENPEAFKQAVVMRRKRAAKLREGGSVAEAGVKRRRRAPTPRQKRDLDSNRLSFEDLETVMPLIYQLYAENPRTPTDWDESYPTPYLTEHNIESIAAAYPTEGEGPYFYPVEVANPASSEEDSTGDWPAPGGYEDPRLSPWGKRGEEEEAEDEDEEDESEETRAATASELERMIDELELSERIVELAATLNRSGRKK